MCGELPEDNYDRLLDGRIQIVGTNFFQSLGMAGKAVFLSLTRQIIFMIPMLLILPPHFGLDGVWGCYPVCDMVATTVTCIMLAVQLKKIKKEKLNPSV